MLSRQPGQIACSVFAFLLLTLAAPFALPPAPQASPAPAFAATTPSMGELALVDADFQISLVRVGGRGLRRLTRGPGPRATPVWSPDGRRLAFAQARGSSWQIFLLDPARGDTRALTRPPGSHLLPGWSPDGRRIAFVSEGDGGRQIFLQDVGGGGARRLTGPPGENTAPAWSPDGRFIAFVARRGHPDWELYVMKGDGKDQVRLTRSGVLLRPGVLQPSWSPDGRRIAYVVRVGRAEQGIYVVAPGGGMPLRLTTGYAPSWSPDGRRVAFVVARVGDSQIYTADPDGGHTRRIIPGGLNFQPIWSPDGRLLAFLASRDGDLALWVMSTEGREQRRLAPAAGDLSQLPVFSWRPPLRSR